MDKQIIKADKRKITGRKVKKLRKEGVIPANIFGKKVKSESIQINLLEFEKVYKETGETSVLELQLGNVKRPVLVHNVQLDPITGVPLHIDFLQVNLKEKVAANIPIETSGESSAEKQGLGTVVQYVDEVEVESLPTDLPEKFEIDLSILVEVDQAIYLKDLKYDKSKVEIKDDAEKIIIKLEPVREEKEEAPIVEEVVETETYEEEKAKEYETKDDKGAENETSES